MAKRIKDDIDKYCPYLNEETNAVEEITLLEIELQILKEEIINEAIKKKHGKIKEIKTEKLT